MSHKGKNKYTYASVSYLAPQLRTERKELRKGLGCVFISVHLFSTGKTSFCVLQIRKVFKCHLMYIDEFHEASILLKFNGTFKSSTIHTPLQLTL